MKTIITIFIISLLFMFSCTQQNRKLPQGAWQLVHVQGIFGDTSVSLYPGRYNGGDIKMWTENNFVFVGHYKNDTSFFDNYGGGTYKLEGNKYEESIQYHADTISVGKRIKMLLELKNDTLVQTWPVDDTGKIIEKGYYVEKYVRIK